MSTPDFFRGTLTEANSFAAGRPDLTVEDEPSEAWPRIWCVVRRCSAWVDLQVASQYLRSAREAMKLARGSHFFSNATRSAMQRDARRWTEWAVAYALRAQLRMKAGLLC